MRTDPHLFPSNRHLLARRHITQIAKIIPLLKSDDTAVHSAARSHIYIYIYIYIHMHTHMYRNILMNMLLLRVVQALGQV